MRTAKPWVRSFWVDSFSSVCIPKFSIHFVISYKNELNYSSFFLFFARYYIIVNNLNPIM